MQIESLRHCLTARAAKDKLKTLPKDLEEAYEQLLANSHHPQELLQMLHWLALSARALYLEELAEVTTIDFTG